MYGIAGYWGDPFGIEAATLLQAMNDALAHRNPDGEGMRIGDRIRLAHYRLSIIDLAGGAQLIASADGCYHIVFNGEISNHRTLRQQLKSICSPKNFYPIVS